MINILKKIESQQVQKMYIAFPSDCVRDNFILVSLKPIPQISFSMNHYRFWDYNDPSVEILREGSVAYLMVHLLKSIWPATGPRPGCQYRITKNGNELKKSLVNELPKG